LRRNPEQVTVAAATEGTAGEVTQFVLVAPNAKSVALVGDFNDWNLSATQLARQAGDGIWWVTVSLPPGRYRYAFVVDGSGWRSDPNAPSAEDEFGRPNSVVTIGGA
jgi:1,4-alpha-glucan branching enzyme